jgi:hypothetical protein
MNDFSRLALAALEKKTVKQLDLGTVVDKFYSKHQITRSFLQQSGATIRYF